MSPATKLGKHSRRCLATPAVSFAPRGVVTVFTGRDLATVTYARHSRVQSKLAPLLEIAAHKKKKKLLLENTSQLPARCNNYELCVREKTAVCRVLRLLKLSEKRAEMFRRGGPALTTCTVASSGLLIVGKFVSQDKRSCLCRAESCWSILRQASLT